MGEVAGVAPGLLGLPLIMLEQRVQLLGQGLDLLGEALGDARALARADRRDGAADPAQRPQAVERLEGGEDEEPEAEDPERAQQGLAQHADLLVEILAILGDLEAPARRRAGQLDVALDDPQGLALELAAVVGVELDVVVGVGDLELAVPQRARRKVDVPGRARRPVGDGADLEIEARIGLEEALVGRRPVEEGLALRTDLGRGDQGGQHIFELGVERARDGGGEDPVERVAADSEQDEDPQRRDADHPPGQRAGAGGAREAAEQPREAGADRSFLALGHPGPGPGPGNTGVGRYRHGFVFLGSGFRGPRQSITLMGPCRNDGLHATRPDLPASSRGRGWW